MTRTPPHSQIGTALREIATGEDEELFFDPVRGELVVRSPGDKPPSDDALPATQMAREGFFAETSVPHIVLREHEILQFLQGPGARLGAHTSLEGRALDGGDVVHVCCGSRSVDRPNWGRVERVAALPDLAHPTGQAPLDSAAPDALWVLVCLGTSGPECGVYWNDGGTWHNVKAHTVPSAEHVFDRNRGILETGVQAGRTVGIVGVGSGGSQIALELVKAGVQSFVLIDRDRIEIENVGRHICDLRDLGRRKTQAVEERLRTKNPYVDVACHDIDIVQQPDAFRQAVARCDVLVGATDANGSRRVINEVALENGVPAIFGRAWLRACGGDVIRVVPGGPCFECLFDDLSPQEEVASARDTQGIAYADRPVAIEPGLALDIAPISLMCSRLVIQELIRGTGSRLESLDADLPGSLLFWANRRDGQFQNWKPAGYGVKHLAVQRWYTARTQRKPGCPACDAETFLANLAH